MDDESSQDRDKQLCQNDLLPPPVKKKYTKEHLLMLTFIYYFKNILSISDIQVLLGPLTEKYFNKDGEMNLTEIYEEIMRLELKQIDPLTKDIVRKYKMACDSCKNARRKEKKPIS